MRTWFVVFAIAACGGSEEAVTVELPVATAGALPAAITDLGYTVQLSRVRVAVTRIEFTIEGEMHEKRIAMPHPGHSAGGEVTGELVGDFVLDWDGELAPLGTATLIVGDYQGANFAIRAASAADGLDASDPLLGHAFHLTGTVTKDATSRELEVILDVEPDTAVIGAVFEAVITTQSDATLAFEIDPTDPFENDTVFDAVDFFALPGSGAIAIRPGDAAHNIIRRAIQTHDHYGVTLR